MNQPYMKMTLSGPASPGLMPMIATIAYSPLSEMPKYMIPRHIRFVDELPFTPTFKVEKYKLKELIMKELKQNRGPA